MSDSMKIDALGDRFEAAWRAGEEPRIEDFVRRFSGDTPDSRRQLLIELVMVDLEYRWRRAARGSQSGDVGRPARMGRSGDSLSHGERPLLEDYVSRFPALGQLGQLPLDMIVFEYRVRYLWGDKLNIQEYVQRFPHRSESLTAKLLMIEAQSCNERRRLSQPDSAATSSIDRPNRPLAARLADTRPFPDHEVNGMESCEAAGCGDLVAGLPWDVPPSLSSPYDSSQRAEETSRGSQQSPFEQFSVSSFPFRLGNYDVLAELGRGGMGVVYSAIDRSRQQRVAIKLLPRPDAESVHRFKREFRTLADLTHPNLVGLYELVAEGDTWFFAMELVEGVDFVRYSRPSPKQPPDFVRLNNALGQVVAGLAALHAAGQIHRDIKPANVLVDTTQHRVVITDFGLATPYAPREWLETACSDFGGTIAYMAPEQMEMSPQPASDWYSVGVMLYQALTDRLPFCGTPMQIFHDKQSEEVLPLGEHCTDIPDTWSRLCCDLLRKNPRRY